MTHDEISKCFDKAIDLLSPRSLSNTIDEDKQDHKSSAAIKLLKSLCQIKSNDEKNNPNEMNLKLKEQSEITANELVANLQKMIGNREIQASVNPHSHHQTPIYNYDANANTHFLSSILQPPETYKSSVMPGSYTNGFAISPALYSNVVYNNEVQNIYSSHAARHGNQSANIFNNPLTPLTGIPISHYYQGFQPQTINPLIINPSTPALVTTPYAGTSNININNLGESLIKLNKQLSGSSLQLQNKTSQPQSTKSELGEYSQKGLQSTFNDSISLKDMIKKK